MQELLNLFTSADIYYQYAEGRTYSEGRESVNSFRTKYNELPKEDKIEFYHLVKNDHQEKVKYFNLISV